MVQKINKDGIIMTNACTVMPFAPTDQLPSLAVTFTDKSAIRLLLYLVYYNILGDYKTGATEEQIKK